MAAPPPLGREKKSYKPPADGLNSATIVQYAIIQSHESTTAAMKKTMLCALSLLLWYGLTQAKENSQDGLANTPENRQLQAERYLQVNSANDIFQDIAERTQHALPETERQPFIDMMTKHLDLETLNATMKQSLIKHFSAEEIAVLADFYSQPAAKSAMSKMGIYMADVIPVVQAEMFKAQQKALRTDPQHDTDHHK